MIDIKRPTPPDFEIASDALKHIKPVQEIAAEYGLPVNPQEFFSFGDIYAKVDHTLVKRELADRPDGAIIGVTAMTPTPKGSGKTMTSIALTDAINMLFKQSGIRKRAMFVLREASMGPTLGMKGGAAGGGYSQVLPMEDINFAFTGDIPAVTQAHNLVWATLMSMAYDRKNIHEVHPPGIEWPICYDLCDRSIRSFSCSPDGRNKGDMLVEGRGIITAASEIMATLGICRNIENLRKRINRILVARTRHGRPITIGKMDITDAVVALLKHAINPNLVQTIYGSGGFIHTGPFANIAHGNSSVAALNIAQKAADYVVTEGGFAADLGGQKMHDLVFRAAKKIPSLMIIVVGTRDLKRQAGLTPLGRTSSEKNKFIYAPDVDGCIKGMPNLKVHVENMRKYGVPVIVAINRFDTDTDEEIETIKKYLADEMDVSAIEHTGYKDGAEGVLPLAQLAVYTIESTDFAKKKNNYKLLYPLRFSLREKIETIAREIYRAGEVAFTVKAGRKIDQIQDEFGSRLNVCMSKTQYSISDDKNVLGDPSGMKVKVTDAFYAGGPGWVVVLCGSVQMMPGMSYSTCAARKIRLVRDDSYFGGYYIEQ